MERTVITAKSSTSYTVLRKANENPKQPAIVSVADLGGTGQITYPLQRDIKIVFVLLLLHSSYIKMNILNALANETIFVCTPNRLALEDDKCTQSEEISLERDYATFLSLPPMKTLLTRCQWIVIILPGQEEGAEDLEKSKNSSSKGDKPKQASMPKFSDMAVDVLEILKKLQLFRVVLFGEGLGANLLARVACLDEEIVLGAVLIHCCGVFLGRLAGVKDKMQQWRANNLPTEPYTERQIIDHRFKSVNSEKHSLNLKDAEAEFRDRLHNKLNLNNIKKLSIVYEQRVSMTEQINRLNCPVLFIAGKQWANLSRHRLLVEAVKKIHVHNQVSIESIEYDDTVSPLVEKPEKVAESLRYFLQGLGLVSCLISSTANSSYKIRGIMPMPSLPDDGVELENSRNDNYTTNDQKGPRRFSPPPMGQQKRMASPFVRRQMSMAELDMPRGPAALSSIKPST